MSKAEMFVIALVPLIVLMPMVFYSAVVAHSASLDKKYRTVNRIIDLFGSLANRIELPPNPPKNKKRRGRKNNKLNE